MLYEHLCRGKKAVSGWKPVLGRVLTMEWMYGVNLLEAAICVTGNLSAYVGRGYPASAYQQGFGVTFKPLVILHLAFRALSTCLVCLKRPHEEQANSTVEKPHLMRLFVWLLDELLIWSLLFSANNSYN